MSILQQIASPNLKYCCIHPQERVVGVCGACLAHKLSSLIHIAAPSPLPQHVASLSQLVGSSLSPPIPLTSAPPHHHDHLLLTINEEADSSTQEIVSNEGLPCSDLEELPSVVDACAVATMHTGNDLAHLTLTHQETSLIRGDVPSINEEKPVVNVEISLISDVRPTINEEIPIINEEKSAVEEGISTTNQQRSGKKSAKCRRSKSLSVLRRESLNDTLRAGHGHDLAAKSLVERTGEHRLGVNKVTLRTLFEIENEEKCRDMELAATATQTAEIQLGARDDQFPENGRPVEKLHDNSIGDSQKTEEVVKDVSDKNEHNSHRCVPSASTFSTSICPTVPDKLKSSVCLNSLLCRKARDEKGSVIKGSGAFRRRPSQVHEANRHNICIKSFDEEGFAGASHRDEGGLVRATYMPSEPRVIRTGRRKLERCIADTSASCSPTSSPASISQVFDSKSERKFNLSARALAVDVPSAILRSSAESSDTSKIAGSLPINDGQASMSTDSDTVEFTVEARPVIPLVLTAEEEQRLAESIASVARKAKGPEAIGNTKILRNKKEQVNEEEHGEMADSPPPPTPDISVEMPTHNLRTNLQPLAPADMMMLRSPPSDLTIDLEEAHEHDALAGTVQVEDDEGRNTVRNQPIPECRNATDNQPECEDTTEKRQILESLDATDNQPVPTYITATESFQLGGQEAKAAYGRSLSCKASSGSAGKQSSHNLAEGVWEPYSSKSGKAAGLFGRSSSRHHKWPSSSRTVKIAPDQSGLLRFYLTPLRASGRTRFLSPRRPPKRRLWSFLSQGAH